MRNNDYIKDLVNLETMSEDARLTYMVSVTLVDMDKIDLKNTMRKLNKMVAGVLYYKKVILDMKERVENQRELYGVHLPSILDKLESVYANYSLIDEQYNEAVSIIDTLKKHYKGMDINSPNSIKGVYETLDLNITNIDRSLISLAISLRGIIKTMELVNQN